MIGKEMLLTLNVATGELKGNTVTLHSRDFKILTIKVECDQQLEGIEAELVIADKVLKQVRTYTGEIKGNTATFNIKTLETGQKALQVVLKQGNKILSSAIIRNLNILENL